MRWSPYSHETYSSEDRKQQAKCHTVVIILQRNKIAWGQDSVEVATLDFVFKEYLSKGVIF